MGYTSESELRTPACEGRSSDFELAPSVPSGAGLRPTERTSDFGPCDNPLTELSNGCVFSLNPTFVESEATASQGLLDQARAGDTAAFCELCRLYETPLLRRATALCGNPTLAEDLAQDTLVEAWKCLGRYNGRCRFFTWLCAILLNRYRNTLREKRPFSFSSLLRPGQAKQENPIHQLPDGEALPDQAAQMHDQADLVRKCVQALPPKHQQVIYLRFYVDDSLEGIAAALGCSVGTVKSRLFHALEKLRGMKELNPSASRQNPPLGAPAPSPASARPPNTAGVGAGAPGKANGLWGYCRDALPQPRAAQRDLKD